MFLLQLLVAVLTVDALQIRAPVANRLLAAALIGSTLNVPVDLNIPQIHNPFLLSAHADVRAAQKRTYFRFIPKFNTGKEFYQGDLKQAIDKENWPVVEKIFELYVTKYNPNDPTQVDASERYVDDKLLRPMTVFAGSFAERGTSPKTRAMLEQEQLFATSLRELEGSVKDIKGEGFFDPVVKAPTGAARKQAALAAWTKGKDALNEYVRLANDGLMFELNKLTTI